jgi:hypothetical protein
MGARPVNYEGQVFGKLTVLRRSTRVGPRNKAIWECQCVCGSIVEILGGALKGGTKTHCGGPVHTVDLTGRTFTRLIALTLVHKRLTTGRAIRYWTCQCSCGVQTTVGQDNLLNGSVKSCGCYKRDAYDARRVTPSATRTKTRGRCIWRGMIRRCVDPRHRAYKDYGGRGITVCERWMSFEAFIADMGEPPIGHTIDRRNVNVGYMPTNCRWATAHEQACNKRSSVYITAFGETKTLSEWAADARCTVSASSLGARWRQKLLTPEEVVTTPAASKVAAGKSLL